MIWTSGVRGVLGSVAQEMGWCVWGDVCVCGVMCVCGAGRGGGCTRAFRKTERRERKGEKQREREGGSFKAVK